MTKYKNALVLLGLTASTMIAVIIGALIVSFPKYYRLSRYGVETHGTVTAKERENHQNIQVEYQVGDKLFKTSGHAEDIGKIFGTVQINEEVSVFYDPSDPKSATLGNPNKQLNSSYRGMIFVGLTPIIFFLGYEIKKKVNAH